MYCKLLACGLLLSITWRLTSAAELFLERSNKNAACGDIGDCPAVDTNCEERCGCDKNIPTSFDNKTQECVINIKLLILSLKEKHNTEDNDIMSAESDGTNGMATKIRAEADKIFKGVIVAAFLFIAFATLCTLTACIYCCRINYTDYQLKKSIEALEKKMGKKPGVKKSAPKPTTAPMAESCNVVVEDAGVFCV